ncbi:hypothetical protein ILUMI_07928 [Ignelater luminosus]|uniref:Tyr recombinase domain-containing protein n=1 Tax=Ignelater luminosus TaxID=2038154 RepID=A0A8K0D2K3_IGNLU|nr:hypothetical protein ILUMI_07928 [Ignelater luminosus]
MAKEVATYLKLPNPESFTGHTFRRSSVALLIDRGGNITDLKRHGWWKSTSVAESYIDESLGNKMATVTKIIKQVNNSEAGPSTGASATSENSFVGIAVQVL